MAGFVQIWRLPGVGIEGFTSSLSGVGNELRRVQRSGSSVAAAHMAGAAALFLPVDKRKRDSLF